MPIVNRFDIIRRGGGGRFGIRKILRRRRHRRLRGQRGVTEAIIVILFSSFSSVQYVC